MSTSMTSKARQGEQGVRSRSRLITGPLAFLFVSTFCTLTSFELLISVTPMYAKAAGADTVGAGLVTGVLLAGTVAAELVASLVMRHFGYRTVLAAGAALLGLPSIVLLVHGSLTVIVIASVLRGFGFGLGTVVMGTLTAVLVPADRRGEGLGLLGIADTVPAVVALPSGVWLAGHLGFSVVVALAAATALIPLGTIPWLPGRTGQDGRRRADSSQRDSNPIGLLDGLRRAALLRPALIFSASTVAAGIVVSFLPLAGVTRDVAAAGLLAQALTGAIGRWWAGRYGDRHGHTRLLMPGLAIAALGMTGLIWLAIPAAVITGMCLFGAGFGILQNSTYVLMIERVPPSGLGTASAIWNLAYDGGYGAGPALFGLVVGVSGYPAAFALTGLVVLAGLPLARRHRCAASAQRAVVGRPDLAGHGVGRVEGQGQINGDLERRWSECEKRANRHRLGRLTA
jgi:predicted MFS family arabinose efflux permease